MAIKVRNKDFYNSAKELAIASLVILENKLQNGMEIPFEQKKHWAVKEDNSCQLKFEQSVSWYELFAKLANEIFNSIEYQQCLKIMQSDANISKHLDNLVGSHWSQTRVEAKQYVGSLLKEPILDYIKKHNFNQEIFDFKYLALENFFYEDKILTHVVAPLLNFQSEVSVIPLTSDLTIRALSLEERGKFLDEEYGMSFSRFNFHNGANYVIEFDYLSEKVLGEKFDRTVSKPQIDINEVINRVVVALRLFKSGHVSNTFIKHEYQENLSGISYSASLSQNIFVGGPVYKFKKEEVSSFVELWTKVSSLEINSVALRRFNYSFLRQEKEDRLIDLMIALEALFLKGEKAGASSGLIISIACSVLIGKNANERAKIQKNINTAYNLRNKIVHGIQFDRIKDDGEKGSHDIVQKSVSEVEDYLRESLKKLLD